MKEMDEGKKPGNGANNLTWYLCRVLVQDLKLEKRLQ